MRFTIVKDKQYIKNKVPDVNEVLSQLNDQEKAELGKAIAGKSKEEQVNILAEFLRNKKVWQKYDEINGTKAGEFEMSVISGWIEESLPNISTALACASAKLPVASMESGAFYALSKGTSIVSKGAPIIGTVLDYGQMVRGGESEQDATNKAIDVGTMELSAAIVGGLLVSAPVSLTVAGTLVLFTGLSMTANSVFDNLYDKIKNGLVIIMQDKYVNMFLYEGKEVLLNINNNRLVERKVEIPKKSKEMSLIGIGLFSALYVPAKKIVLHADNYVLGGIYLGVFIVGILMCSYIQKKRYYKLNPREAVMFSDKKLKEIKVDIKLGLDRAESSIVFSLFLIIVLLPYSFIYKNIFIVLAGMFSILLFLYALSFSGYRYIKKLNQYVENL